MKTYHLNTVTVIILMVITLFSGGILFSQPGQGQRGGQQGPPPVPNSKQIKEMVSNLAKEISLTNEQEVSVMECYTKHFEEVKAKTSGSSRPDREEMEALDKNFENQIKSTLTADQQKKFDAWQKKNKPGQGGRQR